MPNSYALNHLRPGTIAQIIAELIADHADEMDTGEYNFRTEDAKAAYVELLAAGTRCLREEYFWTLIEAAVDKEHGRKENKS